MDLLTYPEYVIFKGIDTLIDEKRIRLGLKLNVNAPLFNPQIFKDNKPPKSDIIDEKTKVPPSTNTNIQDTKEKRKSKSLQEIQ